MGRRAVGRGGVAAAKPSSMTDTAPRPPVWALSVAHGTHTEHLSWGEVGRATHLQALFDAWPYPKHQVAGIGASVRKGRSWFLGGALGAGSDRRVDAILDWMESATFDRILFLDHSRGFVVHMRVVRALEKIRKAAEKKGHRPPPWTRVNV